MHNFELAINNLNDFVFGSAPHPIQCGRGVVIGAGHVLPEINFTLPPMEIKEETWGQVIGEYREMITGVCQRACDLGVPQLLVEFETLPPMTVHPEWGAEVTRLLADTMDRFYADHGLRSALRLTPNDSRDHERPPHMRSGFYWDGMKRLFSMAGKAGADLLAIESTGGKEIHDDALMNADVEKMVFALGILASRDMRFLWAEIVSACKNQGIVPSGDTACGFANTALAMAEQKMLPRVFAALVRVASVPRSLTAYECGAVGPGKDCGYENVYIKAIAGAPISMEGRSASCAHLSGLGNIAQALCDCWSNESVQNVRLLSAQAPVVSMEQLAYDCRMMNVAIDHSREDALRLRDWSVESDASSDPQAWVLKPDVVLRLSREIMTEKSDYLRTRTAVFITLEELKRARDTGELYILPTEAKWLDRMSKQADKLPEDEEAFIADMMIKLQDAPYLPQEYGLCK
jgi:methanol--5-hydroxybenzimidazolylcobamide Co-methyltransferase